MAEPKENTLNGKLAEVSKSKPNGDDGFKLELRKSRYPSFSITTKLYTFADTMHSIKHAPFTS